MSTRARNGREQGARRVCAGCRTHANREQYSHNQWRKRAGQSRCIDCVDRDDDVDVGMLSVHVATNDGQIPSTLRSSKAVKSTTSSVNNSKELPLRISFAGSNDGTCSVIGHGPGNQWEWRLPFLLDTDKFRARTLTVRRDGIAQFGPFVAVAIAGSNRGQSGVALYHTNCRLFPRHLWFGAGFHRCRFISTKNHETVLKVSTGLKGRTESKDSFDLILDLWTWTPHVEKAQSMNSDSTSLFHQLTDDVWRLVLRFCICVDLTAIERSSRTMSARVTDRIRFVTPMEKSPGIVVPCLGAGTVSACSRIVAYPSGHDQVVICSTLTGEEVFRWTVPSTLLAVSQTRKLRIVNRGLSMSKCSRFISLTLNVATSNDATQGGFDLHGNPVRDDMMGVAVADVQSGRVDVACGAYRSACFNSDATICWLTTDSSIEEIHRDLMSNAWSSSRIVVPELVDHRDHNTFADGGVYQFACQEEFSRLIRILSPSASEIVEGPLGETPHRVTRFHFSSSRSEIDEVSEISGRCTSKSEMCGSLFDARVQTGLDDINDLDDVALTLTNDGKALIMIRQRCSVSVYDLQIVSLDGDWVRSLEVVPDRPSALPIDWLCASSPDGLHLALLPVVDTFSREDQELDFVEVLDDELFLARLYDDNDESDEFEYDPNVSYAGPMGPVEIWDMVHGIRQGSFKLPSSSTLGRPLSIAWLCNARLLVEGQLSFYNIRLDCWCNCSFCSINPYHHHE